MQKPSILIIGTVPPEIGSKNFGGVAQVVWNIAKQLKKGSMEMSVGAIGEYYGQPYKIVEGIQIYGVGVSFRSLFISVGLFIRRLIASDYHSIRHLIKLCYSVYYLSYISKKVNFNTVHVHHVLNQIPEAIKILQLDCKIIATIHSYHSVLFETSPIRKQIEIANINSQLDYVDVVTHVSQTVRNQGLALGIQWSGQDAVIYNGINMDQSGIDDRPNEIKQLTFVGSFIERKGLRELLEAADCSEEAYQLNIVGSGKLEHLVDEYPSSGKMSKVNINKMGNLTNTQVMNQMAASKLLVVPSKSESFGLVYLEALISGTPAIGYPPIMKELKSYLNLSEEEARWLIEYDHESESPKDLALKIQSGFRIKEDSDYEMQKIKIRASIEEKLSWKFITAEYSELYRRVSQRKSN